MQKNTVDLLSSHYPDRIMRVDYIPIGKKKKALIHESNNNTS